MDGLRVGWLAALCAAGLALGGCAKSSPVAAPVPVEARSDALPGAAVALPEPTTAELERWIADDAPELPPDRLPAYLRATASCQLGEYDVDPGCPAYKRYADARRKLKAEAGTLQRYSRWGLDHLDHPHPVVRLLAAQLATAQLGENAPALLRRAEREQEPLVLRALLAMLGQPGAQRHVQALRLLAHKLADHPALIVRVQALELLCDSGDPALFRQHLSAEQEPEQAVACRCLFAHPPVSAPGPDLLQVLAQPTLPKAVRAACSQGAVQALCDAGLAEPQRKVAFQAILSELRGPDLDSARPAWQAVSDLQCLAKVTPAAWLERPPLLAALRALVDATAASGFARAEAVRTLDRLQAPRDWLGELADRYRDKQFGADGQVRRALAEVLPLPSAPGSLRSPRR